MLGLFVKPRPTLDRGHTKLRTQHLKADQKDWQAICRLASKRSHVSGVIKVVTYIITCGHMISIV